MYVYSSLDDPVQNFSRQLFKFTANKYSIDTIDTLFNVYDYNGQFILSGREKTSNETLHLFGCPHSNMSITTGVIECDIATKDYGFTNGMVSIVGNNLYVLNQDDRVLEWAVLDIQVDFSAYEWDKQVVFNQDNLKVPQESEQLLPRRIIGNQFGIVVNWVDHSYQTDSAATQISINTRLHEYLKQQPMDLNGRTIITGTGDHSTNFFIGLQRNTRAYLAITYDDILTKNKLQTLKYSVYDDDSNLNFEVQVISLPSVVGKVDINNQIGSIVLTQNQEYHLGISPSDIVLGNNLNIYDLKFENGPQPFEASIQDFTSINIRYDVKAVSIQKIWMS